MKTRNISILFLVSLLFLSFANAEPIAVVIKTRGKVTVTSNNGKKLKARVGTRLYPGTKITTKKKSFAAIRFIDDGSLVRIRSNSTCTVEGKREKSGFFKNLFLEAGTLFSKIVKQKSIFRITTPTSVASVKGTAFWVKQEFKGGTYYFGEEGVVEISNKKGWALLRKGETGYVSSPSSRPIVRKTKKGEKPERKDSKTTIDELEIDFKNQKGDVKSLKFKVKKEK